ncbi:undecaprenyldiphospho-muramoylpentapeptide beta-N-acetylglucosaminyltransferase [Geminocystis sp. NIES-3709]|uniref:undecaprenyldiphospho-muramoylpentapeptide beta-N-acetylglucosaminyltransferase n=1 Tax=Geminocystis sp. NIES-3709 TaxID=1617448 RepID=UPI0005FCD28A|nr:undecaprenyldiphospho-muramoylpentapeptide beta-N-acetylglucosaminyltransferase [Geminocystis sp. NIES-3709]BAQ64930.1 UDP-N-acetylglucosamine--N-acetylmuramyl- [Geminocystis sp. NIES-3709]
MSVNNPNLLIAASGTGGHLFPALAVAQQLPSYNISWLGVPHRLETSFVPKSYPLFTVDIDGFQTKFGIKTILVMLKMLKAIVKTYKLIKSRKIDIVFTTGGYIAAPAIIGAKLAKIPVILHESNYIPGKVTKLFGSWCNLVGIGFNGTSKYLPKAKTRWISTPIREEFLSPQPLDLNIPDDVPLIVAVGGSQGAIGLNKLVRLSAPYLLEIGAYIVHLTGTQDNEIDTLHHDRYLEMPFYDNMAGLLQRANIAISRSGAGTLTELAITKTPSILIPYPFAAEDHQFYNGQEFVNSGASLLFRQDQLTSDLLSKTVLDLLNNSDKLADMGEKASNLALIDSAKILAEIIEKFLTKEKK